MIFRRAGFSRIFDILQHKSHHAEQYQLLQCSGTTQEQIALHKIHLLKEIA
jgi:hypothetical protein